MDRQAFFAALRKRDSGVFGTSLSPGQVVGTESILDECLRMRADLGQAAYILATGYGETGGRMQPVRENMNYSARQIARHFGAHRRQGYTPEQLARKPELLANTVYGGPWGERNLGNTQPGDGWKFRGALTGQMTGRRNFKTFGDKLGVDFTANPELLDDPAMGARSLAQPMIEGWATGKRLSDYVSGSRRDYLDARKVWGGVDAPKYVNLAVSFEAALEEAGYEPQRAPPVALKADPAPDPQEQPSTGWAALVSAILSIFRSNK